jgi:tetratricopeptide (TPR) repeat protein
MLDRDDPYRVECLLSLAAQWQELGEIDQAGNALKTAAATANPRQAVLAEVLTCRQNSLTAAGRLNESEEVAQHAARRFQEWDDTRGLGQAYLLQGDLAVIRGHMSRAAKLLELALMHAEVAGDPGCVARARSLLGITLLFGPAPAEEVIAALDQMVASSANDPRVRAEAEQVTCVMHAMCGRFDPARAIGADARQHLGEVGHGLFLANLAQSTGHIEELAGDLDAAEREYARSCADLQALGESAYLSTVAGLHARLLARRGKHAPAVTALELARTHGSADDAATRSLVLQTEGLLAAAARDVDRARATAAAALQCESGDQEPDAAGEAYRTAAEVEQALGNASVECEHLATAQALFQAKGNVVRAREADSRLRGR